MSDSKRIVTRAREYPNRKGEGPGVGFNPKSGAMQRVPANPLWHRLATRVQAKLIISPADAPYEREADEMADRVMRMPAPRLQRRCAECEEEDEKVYRKENATTSVAIAIPSAVNQALGSAGQSLDTSTRDFFEPRFGHDFSDVRVHRDGLAAEAARLLDARAFTLGDHVALGAGEYAPESARGRRLLAHELAHVVQQGKAGPRIQRFTHATVGSVESLAIEDYETRVIPGNWSHFVSKLRQRDRLIAERLRLVRSGSAEETRLLKMQRRWPTFRSLADSATTDPVTARLPAGSAIDSALENEEADRGDLTGRVNRTLIDAIAEFIASLNSFLSRRQTLAEERTEFARFDSLFADPDVTILVSAISHAAFTAADVKAMVSQETGDLTNTAVHGISSSKPGITIHRLNRRGFIGLGQHDESARDEGIAWARSHGVTIPARPDPRMTPATSIKLTAAYLGRTMDLLFPALPDVKPGGDELKKMVFASYNGGFTRVVDAATSFLAGRTARYLWDNIKNQPSIRPQTRSYVDGIVSRLT